MKNTGELYRKRRFIAQESAYAVSLHRRTFASDIATPLIELIQNDLSCRWYLILKRMRLFFESWLPVRRQNCWIHIQDHYYIWNWTCCIRVSSCRTWWAGRYRCWSCSAFPKIPLQPLAYYIFWVRHCLLREYTKYLPFRIMKKQ